MKVPKLTTRSVTTALIDMAENGVLSWEGIARSALEYMSEDDVADMAHCEFDIDVEDDDDED